MAKRSLNGFGFRFSFAPNHFTKENNRRNSTTVLLYISPQLFVRTGRLDCQTREFTQRGISQWAVDLESRSRSDFWSMQILRLAISGLNRCVEVQFWDSKLRLNWLFCSDCNGTGFWWRNVEFASRDELRHWWSDYSIVEELILSFWSGNVSKCVHLSSPASKCRKATLHNALLNEEKAIVSIAGTNKRTFEDETHCVSHVSLNRHAVCVKLPEPSKRSM